MVTDQQKSLQYYLDKYQLDHAQLQKHVEYFLSSETKYTIISLLDLYDMLNLKALAKISGKSQSTIHKHLEDLMDQGYIQTANTMKGKFYETTELVKAIQLKQKQNTEERDFDAEFEELMRMDDHEFIDRTLDKFEDEEDALSSSMALNCRSLLENAETSGRILTQASIAAVSESYYHIYLMYLLRLVKRGERDRLVKEFSGILATGDRGEKLADYLEREGLELDQLEMDQYHDLCTSLLAEKKYSPLLQSYVEGKEMTLSQIMRYMPVGSLNQINPTVKIATLRQLARFAKMVIDFMRSVDRLSREFDEENKDRDPETMTTQIINFYTGPLDKR